MAPKIEQGFKDDDIKELETKNVKLARLSKAFSSV